MLLLLSVSWLYVSALLKVPLEGESYLLGLSAYYVYCKKLTRSEAKVILIIPLRYVAVNLNLCYIQDLCRATSCSL